MIRLEFDGKCKDCYNADLELEHFNQLNMYEGVKKIWSVHCIHENACDHMEDRVIARFKKEESDG